MMTVVPWATLAPSRSLASSAMPSAPVVAESGPGAFRRLVRGVSRRSR